ncbi:MAG: S-layer homology domain-containing protein [Clostridia bacterium]
MKKRILSAFLALSMLFSIMPTTFAQQEIDSDGNITGTPNMVTDLKIKITEGVLTQFDVTFGDGLNNPDDYFVLLATDFDAGAGNDVTDTITDDSSGTGYVNMYTDVTTGHTSDDWEWLAGPAAQWYGKSKPGDTVSLTWGSALNKTYNWTTGEDGYGCQLSKDFENSVDSIADLQGAKVWVYILSGKNGFTNFSEKGFMSAVGTFDDKGNLQFPEGGDTPTDTEISSVALTVTAPRIGATPATTATTTTTGVVANPAVTWDPADSTFAKNQAYKASVTLSADSGYKFTDSTTATINGKTATVTLNGDGTLKAEYTFDAIKLTGISSNKTGLTSSFAPNDSYTVPDGLEVTLRYSDGTTEVVPYNKFPENNLSLVIGADSATATDLPTKLTLDNNNQTVYVKYSGTDTNDGNPKYQAIDTITVANAKITTAQVSVTYPKPGGTPDTVATVPDGANYTAEVTWEHNGTGVTGNFEYDKAYDAIITVKPNTGYALDNTNGVVLTVKDKTVTNPGADKTATIASDDIDVDGNGEKTVSFDATASTPISASISDSFDLYDKNDVNITLTLGTHVIGDITGITIDGQTLSSSDYTISGNIIKVKGASLATKLTGLTSTAANKNVEITVTGQQNATTATLSAIDTTPYITITDPTQGAITGVTHTSGTKVALIKNTAYTLTAPTVAHTTGYTWTVNGITGTDNGQTYTFTSTGGENITATVALTVDAGHKLTINKTGNGTVTVAKDGGSTLTAETDGTYTVYSDESYTVTATAADQNKVTAVTGETIDSVEKTVTHSVANPSTDTTVDVTFAEKTAPTVSADMTYRKGANDGNKAFTITLGDYSDVNVNDTPSGTFSTDKATYTVSSTDLDSATNGDHTYTFDFGEGMTISKKITVLAARSITSVTAPTGTFAHGDTFKLDGLAFTVKEGETSTTYSYNGTSWDNTLPTGTQFSLDGTNFSDWDAFKAAAESKITRHDTTDSTAVNNGAQITVSLGNATNASSPITVGQKAITVTPSQTTGINKDYDGTVKAPALTATIPAGELVGDDAVTASVTAVYRDGVAAGLTDQNASETDKNVVFTPTLDGANKDNYTIKAISNGSGKINKRTVKIAIINNVPAATKNKADTQTGHATAIIPTNTEYDINTLYEVVDGETVAITYDYSYANISSVGPVSDVTVTNIATTNTNYTVEPTYLENQNGTVNNRTIKSIAISDPTKNEYNYSDTFDPTGIKVTVTYDGETDSVDYDWNAVPDDITLKWTGTEETLSATHKFDSVGTYTITASANGVEPATTCNITVNKLKVSVTASGNITKVYDGKTDLDADDAITYDVTNQSAGYDTQFNADTVTVSNNPTVYDGTSVSTNGVTINKADLTLSNSNYEIENFTNNVTASITARHITVTAITVPTVKQYSNDTDVPVENVGTSAVTFDNVVSGENVTVDYKYTYNDTSVAGNTSNITINNLVLNSTNTVNANYKLDESTPTKSGHVDEREVGSLTVTAPTQFATAQTYGTALALAGLKVQVNFTSGGTSAGSETYVWKDASTWTKQVEGQSDVDVTTVPFTLAWSGTTDVPTQGETLNVQRSTKGITASYTGTSVTGTSSQITVNPITLTKIEITGDDVTKVYEGNKTLTNPAFTYAITEGIINSDTVTVEPTTVEYAEADVHTSKPLNITGFHLTSDNNGNYILGTPDVTGIPNGTITKRPITLTAITNIPAINRFEAGTGTDKTATSATNGGATFEAASTDTGIVSGETVTVIYDYAYADNQTVSNTAVVNLSNVRLDTASDKNYSLTNNATATGVVNEVEATGVTVTIPDKTYEYGDKLDLTGTTVTVDYGNTNTEVYTSDDGVNWKKNDTAVSEKPFTITLPTDKDSLAVGTATVSVKVKEGVEGSVSRTVNKRKVTVNPSKNGDVTKVYNGNTTYTNGVIEWTVGSVNSIDGLSVTLPTVSGATYTYNDSTVALANKITVSAPQLNDTNNFEISGYTNQEFDATITRRPLVITGITIPNVNKYADVSQKVTDQTATSATNATFEAADTDTGIVSGETVGVTFDYKYKTSNPESGTTTDVEITNIALDNSVGTSANYSLTPDSLTGSANVVERTIDSITVANPTQFSDVTYNDKLSIAGLKVTINYTDSTSEEYTATVVNDVVSWALGSVNISEDNIPFTLSWKDTAKGGTFAQGQTLSVTGHNGNQIVANHKNGNDSGEGSAVTIKPIAITSITAAKSGDITKTYNGDTELNDASKGHISYTSTQVISGDTVTLGATPAYENKNVGQNKAISFTTPTVSGNDNYTLGTDATVTGDVVGDITVKTVAISNVYIPSIYKDTEDLVKSISNASAIASGNPTANTVVAADILTGDRDNLTFAYKLTYANSTDANPTVTISDTSVTGTESGNYEFTWPTGLTGTVVADEFTDAVITSPALMQYTHGDTFNPTGLSVTIKTSSNPSGTTYTVVTGTDGNYKWDTDLPAGVNVSLGSILLNSNDALNFKAHYKNMKDQKIKVSAGEKEAETGAVTMLQKQLTATASISTANKVYDSKTALREGQTVTYTIGTGKVQSFNSVTDDVKVTADANYKSADVSKTGETINNVGIEFTNIALSGNDAANYIKPSSIADIAGTIIPYPIHITAINENAPTAYYKKAKSGTIASTDNYTAEMNGLTKPAIKFNYNYGDLVNTVADSVSVPINVVDFVTATDNFEIKTTPSTINGKVEVQGIKEIKITKDNHDYKYGDTLVLNDLSVKVTYADDSIKENIKYNDTDWQTLGLTLNTTLPTDGTVLKNSTDNGKTIIVEKDTVQSDAITINVAKRTVKIERDGSDAITKTYDGTKAVEQTIALKVADLQEGFDGVYNGDITGVTATPYIYSSKDAQNNIALTGTPTLVGSNLDEYTPTYPSLTGNITTKSVTLTPVISEDIYENKFATDDKVITETGATVENSKVTQSGIVSGEEGNFTFAYTVTVPKADLANAATKSYAPTNTSENGTGKGNYTFTWNDASVEIKTNAATSMEVTTDPSDISTQKYYGDSISLDGMVVTITYGNGSTHEFTYGSTEWNNEGFTVAIEDGGNFSKLVTGNNGKHIVVSKTGLNSANTAATLKVNKKDLHLTAEKADGLSAIEKTYDTTTDAKSILKFGITSADLVSGDSFTVDSSNVSATFDTKNQGSDKDITISGLTITGDNSDQYNIIMPSGVKGTINPKSITVKVAGVADILAGVSGEDLKKTASINYSEQPESGVSVTVTATYPDSTQDPAGQKTEKALTFTKTETGNELGNYVFTLDENGVKGYVVSNIINEINVTTPPQTEYTHGDNLSLKGMVIEVKYQDSRDDNIYTCQADGTWKDKNSTTVTELPVSFALEKDGTENALTSQTQQLRRDNNNGAILVVKGGDESNKDTTLTVNKKEITQITIPNPVPSPEKTYDGTTTVTQSISYEGVGVLDADKATVNSHISATANYDTKDVAFDSDGTTVASKAINFTNPTMNENDNYTMSSSATVTTTITGKIKPKDLTVTITSVPSIIVGQSKTVTLTKTTNYTQSGEVTVGENTEEVNLAVVGEYAQNTTAEDNVNVTYSVTNKDSYKNYNIIVAENPTGTVNKKPVTKIEVTSPTKTTWSHGDDLTLDGMTITVTYNNDDTDKKQYKHAGGKWHDVTGGSDAELSGTPDDVTITWGDTSNSATDGVIRLDDTNKGLTADGNNKTTSVKVTSTVKDTNGEYQSASTGDITLTKKQLTLTVSGNVEKPYDKTNNLISGNNVTLTLAGVAGTDGVALNETATKNNIKYAGTTVADTASSPKLVIGTVVLADNANNQYYTVPSGASITNSTTGKINKRPVKIISVTKNMDTSVDASTTGTLEKLVQSTTDGYGISSADGFYSILSDHVIKVDIPYTYSQTSAEGSATVTYDNATAKVSDENADYVANYDVSFAIADGSATISNGTVTGVKIETTGKTEYTHGDSFDLKGTKITVTYNNGAKQDTYEYDTASGKWIKNGTGTPAELPSEIGISLGNTTINANPASDTDKTVVKYDKTNTTPELKATYTKSGSEPIPSTENPTVTLKKKTITITVANSADEIKHTYSGNNSLTADEIGKLTITEPTNFKVGSDDVILTKGTLSATIGSNTNGNVDKNLAISVSGYELSGNDADKYEIKYVSTATGDITKAPLAITISSVPSINENATDLKKTLTKGVNYTQSGEVNNETVNATVNATYPDSTYTDGSADKNVSYTVTNENDYPNYDITIIGSPKGTVTQKTATVEIINQPQFVTATPRPQHGDKLGTDGLNGFEYTVSYSDGTTTKHKYADGDWVTTGGYTAPEDGTAFTWENTNTAVSSDSEIRKDMDNKIKITVPTPANEPLTNKATADKKKVKITANGTYTKVYDGTNTVILNETTPEITYTVSGVVTGDTVTVTATPAFVDENVAKFGDVYQKAINFTNVSISDNYEIENDITPIMGAITPKTINITELTVPSSTKGSAGEKTVTKNKNFTTTDILEKDKDNVTIGYKATFVTSATGTVDATVIDAKVDGSTDQMTLNYVVGTVTGAKIEITSSNHGGGGGGGGGGNSLSIKYENADGTAGKDVSKIEAPAESDPVDLIAVFVTKPADPTVIWTSDNESVATVDENGIVKFIGEGTAIITAQSKTNKTLKDTVTITVTKAVATPTPKPANPTPEPTKEPSIITKTMLNPYIVGYDDNVFGPELPISREEVSAIFARLIANNIYMDKEYDTSFPDVGEGWSKDYIGYLEKFSVVTGYEDGTFRPQNYITRAEMAVMMAKAEGYDISGYMSSDELAYPDVDEGYSEWAVKAIKYLTDRGIMEGYPDGTFGPNRPITRAETVATVNRVLADMTVGNIEVLPSDMTEAHWAYNDVVFAMNHRILKDVAADESQFIKSEEYDKNKITETEVVEDTSDENAGAGASPTPEPSPTPNA